MTQDQEEHPDLAPLAQAVRTAQTSKGRNLAKRKLVAAMVAHRVARYEYDVGDIDTDPDSERVRLELVCPEPTVNLKIAVPKAHADSELRKGQLSRDPRLSRFYPLPKPAESEAVVAAPSAV